MAGIGGQLIATADVALQYWYLLSVPLIVAAFHFGFRGAAAVSVATVLILIAVFFVAGDTFGQVTGALERLIVSSASPEEARKLAVDLADLRSSNPQTAFLRAITGLILVIVSMLLMGSAVDGRARTTRLLQQALQLRRYFSPQLAEVITSEGGQGSPRLASSRKEVTLLFADLRNFTALSERMAPEELVGMLNEFLTAMTDEIVKHDGTLDKYIGDAVMAFFGDPRWYPDHAERACRAALAMQGRMRELQAQWRAQGRESTGMGIGIGTGHATVGNVGSPTLMEYTAVGSPVNVASRLSELAAGGQILTTVKTYWRVQAAIEGAPREPTPVKGFPNPVEIVEVLGARVVPQQPGAVVSERMVEVVSQVVGDPVYRASLLGNAAQAASAFGLSEDERNLAEQVAILCGYPIFHGVPAEEIALLMGAASVESVGAGTAMVREGAVEDKFYLILQGDVAVMAIDATNRETHVASLARGDHFGEVALLFDTPRNATVRTISPSRFAVLRRDNFYAVLNQAPTLKNRVEATARRRMVPAVSMPWPDTEKLVDRSPRPASTTRSPRSPRRTSGPKINVQ